MPFLLRSRCLASAAAAAVFVPLGCAAPEGAPTESGVRSEPAATGVEEPPVAEPGTEPETTTEPDTTTTGAVEADGTETRRGTGTPARPGTSSEGPPQAQGGAPGLPLPTVVVVPSGPPPPRPPGIAAATATRAPDPDADESDLLDAVARALERQARGIYFVDAPRGLVVGETADVIVGLKRAVRLSLSDGARTLAEGGRLAIELDVFAYGADGLEFEARRGPARLGVDLETGTLGPASQTGEIARFTVTPGEAGTEDVWLVLANPRLGGTEVAWSVELPLRRVTVASEPLGTRLLALLMSAALILGALTEVVFKPLRGLWSLVRKRGSGGQATGQPG
jgi:hypothetical protein